MTSPPGNEPVREPGYSEYLLPPHAPAPEPPRRMSGPAHYAEAGRYARMAADAVSAGDPATAAVLAALGQLHATLAVAAATALAAVIPLSRSSFPAEVQAWRDAAGTGTD